MTKLEQNSVDLRAILDEVNTLPLPTEPVLQDKTVAPSTAQQLVTPDSGYDGLSSVTVNAINTVNQVTPSITVSSGGLITASATQSAGYVVHGTKSATKQLTTQEAKTVTPSTSSQTAVASGRYTTGAVTVAAIPSTYVKPTTKKSATTYTPTTSNQTIAAGTYCSGAQTIKGDANLVAGNIKSGVSIFGVTGTYAGTTENLDSVITELETKTATLNTTLEGKASGGGGGGSIETCAIKIVDTSGHDDMVEIAVSILDSGVISSFVYESIANSTVTIRNVIVGSAICITRDNTGYVTDCIYKTNDLTPNGFHCYKVTSSDAVGTFTVSIDASSGGY